MDENAGLALSEIEIFRGHESERSLRESYSMTRFQEKTWNQYFRFICCGLKHFQCLYNKLWFDRKNRVIVVLSAPQLIKFFFLQIPFFFQCIHVFNVFFLWLQCYVTQYDWSRRSKSLSLAISFWLKQKENGTEVFLHWAFCPIYLSHFTERKKKGICLFATQAPGSRIWFKGQQQFFPPLMCVLI